MNEYKEFAAKTLDEAIANAIIELETSSDHLEYEVIQNGTSGFFGIGAKPAIIKARKKDTPDLDIELSVKPRKEKREKPEKKNQNPQEKKPEKKESSEKQEKLPKKENPEKKEHSEKPEKKAAPEKKESQEKKPEKKEHKDNKKAPKKEHKYQNDEISLAGYEEADLKEHQDHKPTKEIIPIDIEPLLAPAVEFLKSVFTAMGMEVNIDAKAGDEINTMDIELSGDNMGVLIGKRGQTLDSLQYLTSLVVNKDQKEYVRIKLDTEDYRRRRKDTLENLAKGIAYKVKKTRKSVVLEPMNPYERRIIHSTLQNNKFVETTSEGEEPYRHVVVKLKRG